MAALDFPTSPTTGATYAGGNGVVYTYNGTVWLASGASAGGDFFATGSGGAAALTTPTPVVPTTIITGNAGWYNTSNGRFTPPAGRYNLFGYVRIGAAGNTAVFSTIHKNGVAVSNATVGTNAPGSTAATANTTITVDANGTDYFDLRAHISVSTATLDGFAFGAFPISGIKGPPGDAGIFPIVRVQKFTASGTYTPHANMITGYAVGIGGGGGGGGAVVSPPDCFAACGGASGNTVTTYFLRAAVLPTVSVTIGGGGAGGSGGAGAGGGDTSFGSLLLARGGNAGGQYNPGGANTGTNTGDIVALGHAGGSGQFINANAFVIFGGSGGGAGAGPGASAGNVTANTGYPGLANSGGGGGGGAAKNAGPGNIIGGNGGTGYLYVVENCTS